MPLQTAERSQALLSGHFNFRKLTDSLSYQFTNQYRLVLDHDTCQSEVLDHLEEQCDKAISGTARIIYRSLVTWN